MSASGGAGDEVYDDADSVFEYESDGAKGAPGSGAGAGGKPGRAYLRGDAKAPDVDLNKLFEGYLAVEGDARAYEAMVGHVAAYVRAARSACFSFLATHGPITSSDSSDKPSLACVAAPMADDLTYGMLAKISLTFVSDIKPSDVLEIVNRGQNK